MYKKPVTNKAILCWIILLCLTQLVACSLTSRRFNVQGDGAPPFDVDVSKIPDAEPKKEPFSSYANKSYDLNGRHYKVLKSAKGYTRSGTASWYGSMFHDRLTSTGERYNMFAMTAASTELPIPCYVKVTNLENGKEVVVRVNDRGPFENKRIIDLSFVAAKKLGFANKGVARVRVAAIDPDKWHKKSHPVYLASNPDKPVKANVSTEKKVYLQVGAFAELDSAKKLSKKINQLADLNTEINKISRNEMPLYRVRVGPLLSLKESDRVKNLLKDNGLGKNAMVVSG
jgi:rare lipoprotein A